jgi:hypothetical protein
MLHFDVILDGYLSTNVLGEVGIWRVYRVQVKVGEMLMIFYWRHGFGY